MLPAAPCELPAEYPLAFFKEAIILIAVSFQLSLEKETLNGQEILNQQGKDAYR